MESDSIFKGKSIIPCRWVYRTKRNIECCSNLVSKGYTQITGIDFAESFAPVFHNITFCLFLIIYLQNDSWSIDSIDIETAFLYGKLDEPLYMEIPEGFFEFSTEGNLYNHTDDIILELHKTIYGVVQASKEPLMMSSTFILRRSCFYSTTKLIPACTIAMTIMTL